ncbi:MAG: hypothetical protein WCJ55_15580 [Chloroflexales bacterium]
MVALVVLVALAGIVIGGFMVAGALRPRVDPSATAIAGDPLLTVTPAPMTPMADTPIPSSIPAATAGISASNLEVQIMAVSPNQPHIGDVVNVRVRVRNVSGKVISDSFWVDLYVSPTGAPTALVPWSEIAAYGATWRVTGLGPGESRDLNSLDADPTRSNLLRLNTPGTYQLYVLADTLNELPVDLSSGTARPIYLGGPTEVMVGNASTPP